MILRCHPKKAMIINTTQFVLHLLLALKSSHFFSICYHPHAMATDWKLFLFPRA